MQWLNCYGNCVCRWEPICQYAPSEDEFHVIIELHTPCLLTFTCIKKTDCSWSQNTGIRNYKMKEKTHTVIKFATKGNLYKKLKKKKRIREKGYKNRKKREWDKGLLWWLHILFIRPSR